MIPELAKHTEKLVYFVEVLKDGSLQASGRRLGMTAATLSYSINELEKVTGVRLLERSKKGVSPTEAGQRLYDYCRTLFMDLENVQLKLNNLDRASKKRIRIGTFPSIAIYFWPLLQGQMTAESEALSISLTTKRSREVLEALVRHEIDLAITVECFDYGHLVRHELYSDTYGFYVKRGEGARTLNEKLAQKSVLLYIPDAMDSEGKSLRQYVHGLSFNFKEEFELDSLEVISEFLKKGLGVALLPTRVAQNLGSSVVRLRCPEIGSEDFGPHKFYLSYRNDLGLPQRTIDAILNAARSAVKKMVT